MAVVEVVMREDEKEREGCRMASMVVQWWYEGMEERRGSGVNRMDGDGDDDDK